MLRWAAIGSRKDQSCTALNYRQATIVRILEEARNDFTVQQQTEQQTERHTSSSLIASGRPYAST